MQIVINIDDEDYDNITLTGGNIINLGVLLDLREAVRNGTPLPKGHGRILDEKDILDIDNNDGGWYDLVDMPEYIAGVKAIIEADKGESEDKE